MKSMFKVTAPLLVVVSLVTGYAARGADDAISEAAARVVYQRNLAVNYFLQEMAKQGHFLEAQAAQSIIDLDRETAALNVMQHKYDSVLDKWAPLETVESLFRPDHSITLGHFAVPVGNTKSYVAGGGAAGLSSWFLWQWINYRDALTVATHGPDLMTRFFSDISPEMAGNMMANAERAAVARAAVMGTALTAAASVVAVGATTYVVAATYRWREVSDAKLALEMQTERLTSIRNMIDELTGRMSFHLDQKKWLVRLLSKALQIRGVPVQKYSALYNQFNEANLEAGTIFDEAAMDKFLGNPSGQGSAYSF